MLIQKYNMIEKSDYNKKLFIKYIKYSTVARIIFINLIARASESVSLAEFVWGHLQHRITGKCIASFRSENFW